jgi:hypothetical protein
MTGGWCTAERRAKQPTSCDAGTTQVTALQQPGTPVAGDEEIRVPGFGHGQKKCIVRIIGFEMPWQPVQNQRPLEVVDHHAHLAACRT